MEVSSIYFSFIVNDLCILSSQRENMKTSILLSLKRQGNTMSIGLAKDMGRGCNDYQNPFPHI